MADAASPEGLVLSLVPHGVRVELLRRDVLHPPRVRGPAEIDVRRDRLVDRDLRGRGLAQPPRGQLPHRGEPQVVRHEGDVGVAPRTARLEGEGLREGDRRGIRINLEDVLPPEAEGATHDLLRDRDPPLERGLPHGLPPFAKEREPAHFRFLPARFAFFAARFGLGAARGRVRFS